MSITMFRGFQAMSKVSFVFISLFAWVIGISTVSNMFGFWHLSIFRMSGEVLCLAHLTDISFLNSLLGVVVLVALML